jgi:hypothetical protein
VSRVGWLQLAAINRPLRSEGPPLILVAEHDGPTMMARIGVMRALNAGRPDPAIMPRRKGAKAYRIVK